MQSLISILLAIVMSGVYTPSIMNGVRQSWGAQTQTETVYPHAMMTEEDFLASGLKTISNNSRSVDEFSMVNYFKNLKLYYPMNSFGSCGYVSFIQYLTFYDTFYNDAIVPEVYERKQGNVADIPTAVRVSPGVQRLSYPKVNLYSYIQSHKVDDFQMFLMDIVNSAKGISSDAYSYSIHMKDYHIILDALFPNQNIAFTFTGYKSLGKKPTDSNVINWFDSYVKNKLDIGIPVMLHIAKYNDQKNELDEYHSVVAYYYDASGIHAHFGWGAGSADTVISSDYQITEAGVMDTTNIPLTHSNNYIVDMIPFCGCGHHTHRYAYMKYNNSYHKRKCICMSSWENSQHILSTGSGRYKTCYFCKDTIDTGSGNFPGILD